HAKEKAAGETERGQEAHEAAGARRDSTGSVSRGAQSRALMDIDFPLLLTSAVLLTGVIWLLDAIAFAPRRADGRHEPKLVEYARSFFPVLLIVLVLRSFLAEPYRIPS